MYPNRFRRGNAPVSHKENCRCFRCSGVPWNKGVPTKDLIGKKISLSLLGTERRRGKYKDEFITYSGIHRWLGKHLPNKGVCNVCKLVKFTEVSNNEEVSKIGFDEWAKTKGEKIRDFSAWEWICKSCHRKKDHWDKVMLQKRREKGLC